MNMVVAFAQCEFAEVWHVAVQDCGVLLGVHASGALRPCCALHVVQCLEVLDE